MPVMETGNPREEGNLVFKGVGHKSKYCKRHKEMYTFKQRKNRKYVNSKIMYFIEYDLESMVLKIGFNDGTVGYFNDVPQNLVQEFDSADSKGSFFYQHLYKAGYKTEIKVA